MRSAAPELARSMLEAAPDAMVVIDSAGIIRFVNRRVCTLFGYAHDELVGQRVELLMPERFQDQHVHHREDYNHNMRTRLMDRNLPLIGRRRDGSEFPVEISLSPIEQHDDELLIAAAIRDVTDRKLLEAELIAARAAAEEARRSAESARAAAEQARETADQANRSKSRFLATASHDLRQPLQSLALLNGILRLAPLDAQSAEAVMHQEQAIGTMSRLLNAFLDISKLESGAVKPEPADFAVATILDPLRREFAGVAAGKGLALEIDAPAIRLHTDPALLEQVLRNLVSNAIKYTRRGSVALRCLRVTESLAQFEVIDTGVGIPADQISRIYDEFYQIGVPANSSHDGYGLGLAIVKRIVALLELQLEVTSQVGVGSVFTLYAPAATEQSPAAPRASDAACPHGGLTPSRANLRVLLVEDDSAVLDATRMLLRAEGYHVTTAGSLAEALEAARAGIDLLMTDYHLSHGQTGTQVITTIRQALGAPLKSVLITGDTSTEIRALPRDPRLRIANKPLTAEAMLSLLDELIASD
ncbi:MAG: PAS domain S-box protein [Pseudomonadota bacterium]|jgi:PAS domain S-box-containing protein|nr:PAS domain S-box protein [Pseudomonadota bacterium]